MTEIGMALSCGLDFRDRVDGAVGWSLPGVEVRLVDSETGDVIGIGEEEVDEWGRERVGEIQVRGPTVFKEYWRNEKATVEGFVEGWFKTGDVAVRRRVEGAGEAKGDGGRDWCVGPVYFILGRMSADIIKTGGEKVSALEVERELLSLPEVSECAVVGLKSETWGQKVAAVVVLSEVGKTAGKGGKSWGAMDMRRSLRDKLANYKIPQEIKFVDDLVRNAMGKGELWNSSFFLQFEEEALIGRALTFEQSIRRCLSRKCLGRIQVRWLNGIVQEVECVRSTFWGGIPCITICFDEFRIPIHLHLACSRPRLRQTQLH
jgi:acyl-CoA synthetase (AMP-forming)/AMP-acid ligase II